MNKKVNKQKEGSADYNTFQNSAYILKHVWKWQRCLAPISFLHMIMAAFNVFMLPILIKLIIDQVENGNDRNSLFLLVGIYTILAIIIYAATGYFENQEWWRILYCRMNFMKEVMRKALTMDYEKLEDSHVLDCHQKAMNATNDANKGVEGMMRSMISVSILILQIMASAAIICTLNPLLVLIMLSIILLQFIPVDRTKKKDKREVWDALTPFWRKLYHLNFLTRDFEFAKDVRLYDMSSWIYHKHIGVNKEVQDKVKESRNMWMKCHSTVQICNFIQETILYAWLVYWVLFKGLSIGNFTLYVAAVRSFSSSVGNFLWQYAMMRNQSMEVNDFRGFLEFRKDEKSKSYLPMSTVLQQKNGETICEFKFEDVSFCYEGQTKYALENLNLTVASGKRLAVVGLNGAGKSTMIKLLCRLYEPTSGKILLNGVDIREFDKNEYYKIFAPVFQNVEVYAFPISENVSMRVPCETDCKRAEKCLEEAGLGAKIKSLDKGVQTQLLKILYDDGIDMSGGEKQKLALARALYKDAPVVLLDEPTSALDAIAEYNLYKNFDHLIENKTAIYISHRLSSTRFCHSIAMFKDGKMIEYGTHDELMDKDGEYAELFRIQAQYYKEDEKEVEIGA